MHVCNQNKLHKTGIFHLCIAIRLVEDAYMNINKQLGCIVSIAAHRTSSYNNQLIRVEKNRSTNKILCLA
jgi:hypothetical protein